MRPSPVTKSTWAVGSEDHEMDVVRLSGKVLRSKMRTSSPKFSKKQSEEQMSECKLHVSHTINLTIHSSNKMQTPKERIICLLSEF